MGQGAGASAFNIPGVNDPQLASLLSQLSTTNLPTWNSYLQSQPPASSPTAASPQTSSPTAQAASPQAGSAAAVTAMLQRIMPGFIGDLSPVVPAVLAQAQAGGHVQPSQGSAPATPGSNRLGAPPPGQGGGFRFPREAILRFIMDRAPGAVQEDRASGTRRRIETEQESARYDAENRLAQRRSAQREQIWGAEYGRNLAISNALRAAGIRPIDLELAQRNQVLAQAGIRPA